jgi:hypothetical protein
MRATISIALSVMLLLFAYATTATANTIGFTYSQIINDRSLGLTGDYQTALANRVQFEADAQIQAGNIYNAKLNTNFIFDISTVDLKVLIANSVRGHTLQSLGRSQSVGLAFTVPIETFNVDVGIGGTNASPFAASNAFDTLVGAGFAESAIEGKGLSALTPASKGIPFRNGSALNAFLSTGFRAGIFDVDVKGVLELLGEGDKMHQVNTTFKTGGKVYGALIMTSLEIGLASYQDLIHRELATITTAGFDF